MKPRKIPMRTCIVTKEKLPKIELIRVVRSPEGIISIDESGKQNGRGCYLKKDLAVVDKCQKNKSLDKHLEINVPDEIYNELRDYIGNKA